jgi:orotidine-5'-phosphate decarboxylase
MNFRERLIEKITSKKSIVCIGLDPFLQDIQFPVFVRKLELPKLEFCKMIIDEVADLVAVVKPNSRFFMPEEYRQLQDIVKYAHSQDLEVIGDVKENDIGSTMAMGYIRHFEGFNYDAITINPYLGSDGVVGGGIYDRWFKAGKGIFVLVKTSNSSSKELQDLDLGDPLLGSEPLKIYSVMASLVEGWSKEYDHTIGAVIGANYPEQMQYLRSVMNGIFLMPGYGAQGGTAEDVKYGIDISQDKWCIVNSSRGIMYAWQRGFKDQYAEHEFAEAARREVEHMNKEINKRIEGL